MQAYFIAALAGISSILSPCVLPLLPILIASGTQAAGLRSTFGLPLGMGTSFALIGLLLQISSGYLFGISKNHLDTISAILLIIFGLLMLMNILQQKWVLLTHGFSNFFYQKTQTIDASLFKGQFLIGALLGVAWMPCIGPQIASVLTLALQQNPLKSALLMLIFTISITLPVILMLFLSKKTVLRNKNNLRLIGYYAKIILGILMCAWGIMILFHWDKRLASFLLML
jgi:cytochrome c-type biogenesis protein